MQNPDGIAAIQAKIAETETEIRNVVAKIESVEIEIVKTQDQQEKRQLRDEEDQLREEEKQLRDQAKQLRDEAKQLRDEKARLDDEGAKIQFAQESEINFWSDGPLRHAAKNAFEAPYQDSIGVVQSLIEAMDKCRQSWQTCEDPHEKLYAPYMAVVQASMMGKTRTFFTLQQHNIYVFYICLRDDGSYPSGILEVIQALTSEACTEGYYAAFTLAALEALNIFMSERNSCFEWFQSQQNPLFWKPILGEEVLDFPLVTYT
jgi:hypothetical protein